MATFEKFAVDPEKGNKWGITNDRGDLVTESYLRRYVQCWCRAEHGYVLNRKANFEFFMSDEFIKPLVASGIKTASQIGKAASIHPRWGKIAETAKGVKPVTPKTTNPAPESNGWYTDDNGVLVRRPGYSEPAPAAPAKTATLTAEQRETHASKMERITRQARERKQADIEAMRKSLEESAAAGNDSAKHALQQIEALEAAGKDPVAEALASNEAANQETGEPQAAEPAPQVPEPVVEPVAETAAPETQA